MRLVSLPRRMPVDQRGSMEGKVSTSACGLSWVDEPDDGWLRCGLAPDGVHRGRGWDATSTMLRTMSMPPNGSDRGRNERMGEGGRERQGRQRGEWGPCKK